MWAIPERIVRSERVVVPSPFDQCLRFLQCVEVFPVQELVSKLGIETLAVAVRPGRSRLDEERLHADPLQPLPERGGSKLGPNTSGRATSIQRLKLELPRHS